LRSDKRNCNPRLSVESKKAKRLAASIVSIRQALKLRAWSKNNQANLPS
jgi:hypothetical protein